MTAESHIFIAMNYPYLNTEPAGINGVVTEPENVGAYEVSMTSEWVNPPRAPVLDLSRGNTFLLNWSTDALPNPQGVHYPRYGSDPLLRAAINGGNLELSSVDVAISRNALRKLSTCFMPRSNKFTHDFSLTVEQISEKLTVIRKCPGEHEEFGSAGFALDFEHKLTLPDPDNGPFSAYYEAMSYNIGDYRVLVGCEVDAVDDTNHSVELKTSKVQDLNQEFFLNQDRAHKRDVWMQMKLSGTNTLYLGKVTFPDGELANGDEGSVTVQRLEVNAVRDLGQFNAEDERRVFAKVAELLRWIKESLPFTGARRVAILNFIKEVDYQAAKPERLARPALPANRQFPARPAIPYRAAQDAIQHVEASLTLTVQEFSQDKSTISEDFYSNILLPLINH